MQCMAEQLRANMSLRPLPAHTSMKTDWIGTLITHPRVRDSMMMEIALKRDTTSPREVKMMMGTETE